MFMFTIYLLLANNKGGKKSHNKPNKATSEQKPNHLQLLKWFCIYKVWMVTGMKNVHIQILIPCLK